MRSYLLRRLWQSAVTLVGVSILVFVILRVIPGDPAKMLLPEGAPQSAVEELNRHLGLRRPIYVQYGLFLRSVVRGDFGQSFQYRSPALTVVVERLPATLQLTLAAMALTVLFGVSIGIVAAVRQGTGYDYAGTALAVLGQSLPNFWLGIMLILLFGVTLGWLPTSGYQGPSFLVLPAVTLAAYPMVLVGGAVITESVFAWPGIGKLAVDSIFQRDLPVIQVVLILAAAVFIVINLIVDLLYTVLDPRIRYS